MGIRMNFDKYFPHESYRKYQRETIEKIIEAFDSGDRCVILEAPTGVGKTAVNLTVARAMFDKAFYVTTQKVLQDQILEYYSAGKDLAVVKGRNEYRCKLVPEFNCEEAICQIDDDFKCPVEHECEYIVARNRAIDSPIAVINFAYAFRMPRHLWDSRDLLIVDESHNIDVLALDMVSVTFNLNMFRERIPVLSSDKEYAEYLMTFEDDLKKYLWSNYQKFKKTKKEVYAKNVRRVRKLLNKLERFYVDVVEDGNQWVWERDERKITFMPVTVERFLRKMLWDLGYCILVSSATIISPKMYVKETGLDFLSGKIKYIAVPMSFPKENRPIYFVPCGKMSINHKYENVLKVADYINELLKKYDGESVIVHCNSYENARMIVELLNTDRKVILQRENGRDESLREFIDNKGSVFISVKMTEGIDLAYDTCRVQVCAKVPFLYLGDKRIAKRLEYDDGEVYYKWKAIMELSQSYGRAVRAPDDYAVMYILDSDFGFLWANNKELFPKWFREAIVWGAEPKKDYSEVIKVVCEVAESLDCFYGDFSLKELERSLSERGEKFSDVEVSIALNELVKSGKLIYYKDKNKFKVVK